MADMIGDNSSETLSGTNAPEAIQGLGGTDIITGLDGADTISGGDGSDDIDGGEGDDTIYGHSVADLDPASGAIQATLLADVGPGAVFVTSAPGDEGFVYSLTKDDGVITRIDTTTGEKTTFLDIPDTEFTRDGERGVLGVAFDPDYEANGRFFVYLTNEDGDCEIREYARQPGDPPTADPAYVQTIITIPHPGQSNHNGGSICFGPDGYLYVSVGDGGGGNDPLDNAQNLDVLLGKILRIDVGADDFAVDPARNYAIPDDNPFAGSTPGADEIWDYGLRNPFRISFDPLTGDLYIGDVGQDAREEVDFEATGNGGGVNYGWSLREGFADGPRWPPASPVDIVDPIADYDHTVGNVITGGYVYRGPAPGLQGAYFFADFGSNKVFTLSVVDGVAEDVIDHTTQIVGADLENISSFGTDSLGNLYAVTFAGEIYRLDPSVAAGDGGDTLDGGSGNDAIYSGAGDDRVNGGSGDDAMSGGQGDDMLRGGHGIDASSGDDGDDIVFGGAGADSTAGGGGDDVLFIIFGHNTLTFSDHEGADTVVGYKAGTDEFDLTGVSGLDDFDDLSLTANGDDVLVDYGSGSFLLKNTELSSVEAGDFLV